MGRGMVPRGVHVLVPGIRLYVTLHGGDGVKVADVIPLATQLTLRWGRCRPCLLGWLARTLGVSGGHVSWYVHDPRRTLHMTGGCSAALCSCQLVVLVTTCQVGNYLPDLEKLDSKLKPSFCPMPVTYLLSFLEMTAVLTFPLSFKG